MPGRDEDCTAGTERPRENSENPIVEDFVSDNEGPQTNGISLASENINKTGSRTRGNRSKFETNRANTKTRMSFMRD